MTRRYKITLAYDGTAYCGYQRQGNGIAVQQRVEEALEYVNLAHVAFHGCSRTDSGVHAKGFVGYADLDKPIPPKNFVRAMNARLPPDIRVMRASITTPTFDAQRDVKGKEYRYFVYNAPILPPYLYPYWEHERIPLDLWAMQSAADRFVGTHDFKAFSSIRPGQGVPLQAGARDGGIPPARRHGRREAGDRHRATGGPGHAHRARSLRPRPRTLPLARLVQVRLTSRAGRTPPAGRSPRAGVPRRR